jgi:signal transduction histidine kinase
VRVLQAQELRSLPGLPPDADRRLTNGEHLWLVQGQRTSPLLFPMKSLSTLRGAILLPPKRQGALYTTEDFTLLATIASLGALALHHATTLIDLDAIQRKVVEATRDDKRFALSVVGAELSHEIAYPLNFLRFLLKRCARGDALEHQDLEIGSEEVARLERMLDAMKKLGTSSTELEVVRVLVPVRHAVELIREQVEEKHLQVRVEVPEQLCVLADADMVLQIFANLLRNSAQAVGEGGSIGVRVTPGGDFVQVECWDDGPGVPPWLREKIWTPWASTTRGGTGLGLVITQRLVQKLGWRITLETRGERTSFCVHVPASSLREPPAPAGPEGMDHLAEPAGKPRRKLRS